MEITRAVNTFNTTEVISHHCDGHFVSVRYLFPSVTYCVHYLCFLPTLTRLEILRTRFICQTLMSASFYTEHDDRDDDGDNDNRSYADANGKRHRTLVRNSCGNIDTFDE